MKVDLAAIVEEAFAKTTEPRASEFAEEGVLREVERTMKTFGWGPAFRLLVWKAIVTGARERSDVVAKELESARQANLES